MKFVFIKMGITLFSKHYSIKQNDGRLRKKIPANNRCLSWMIKIYPFRNRIWKAYFIWVLSYILKYLFYEYQIFRKAPHSSYSFPGNSLCSYIAFYWYAYILIKISGTSDPVKWRTVLNFEILILLLF